MQAGWLSTGGAAGAATEAMPMLRPGWGVAEVAHDARSMVTALGLYCELLAEPGVLSEAHLHYLDELRLVAAASRRIVEKLSMVAELTRETGTGDALSASAGVTALPGTRNAIKLEPAPGVPIADLAQELAANRNLLDAIAGAGVAVRVRAQGGALPVRLNGEDLTRVLVNLVKNAAEAGAGEIEIALRERRSREHSDKELRLRITVDDNGPGIPPQVVKTVFEPGCTTRTAAQVEAGGGWPRLHRGLGLSITRSILEAAGGRIRAAHRPGGGARFLIELPVRQTAGAAALTRNL